MDRCFHNCISPVSITNTGKPTPPTFYLVLEMVKCKWATGRSTWMDTWCDRGNGYIKQ